MASQPRSVRVQAAITLAQVLQQQASLASLMAPAQEKVEGKDRGLLQELCFGTLRWQPRLQSIIGRLLDKPLKPKDSDIQALLLLGLYQIEYTRIPEHAALSSTVEACRELKKPWAGKLVNGVLRRYLRERESLQKQMQSSPAYQSVHPNWLRKQIRQSWPDQAEAIFDANNAHPLSHCVSILISRSVRPYYPNWRTPQLHHTALLVSLWRKLRT